MKYFNRIFVGLALSFALVAFVNTLGMSTNAARQAKASFTTPYSLSPSSVTTFTVLESTPAVIKKPGAVYAVIMSTGALGEFLIMFDSNSASGITSTLRTPNVTQLGPPIFYAGVSSNTVVVFDPPLKFNNGLMVIDSAITGQGTIIWEEGQGIGAQ
jgi:hypothetical protein